MTRSAGTVVGPSYRFTDHGHGITVPAREEFQGWPEGHAATSSDIRIGDAQYIAAGDQLTARLRAIGVQDGPIPAGFPASHKPFLLDMCEVWHFGPDGLADEAHNYADGLGHLPMPE